ncbi:MAG TPA: PHB depolymerase family esterase [Polyangiaceae bacterium]|jgi:poly(hydroxyalkanoate) depolymerase family esterase|nr:PHB depolymerase family esterase [Polyangiaceae bacterium]
MRRCFALAALTSAVGLLTAPDADAAKLTGPVTGWASGVPSYISMYEYVPDKPAENPPILVVAHYCGGNAQGVFGEAQGGGIVAAADQYGFIMVFPQTSNNCWDVGTTKSLTHDGGGDTQAVAQMVTYALSKHTANPQRVYVVGTSSGAMMTEALLAVYPEMFKAGAEFAGVPAGCWAASYSSSNQWSGPCAGGMVTHTAAEWGTLVHAMDPGYTGPRPRVQLWHGMADPTINYQNHLEAIKEWTNVLGLSEMPASTTMVTLSNHSWTRESWQDSCGNTLLDAWAEKDGPHGTDSNLNAMYVIPFLGLDKVGPTDPVTCGGGGMGSAGAASAGAAGRGGNAGAQGGANTGGGGALGGTGNGVSGGPGASGNAGVGLGGAAGTGVTGASGATGAGQGGAGGAQGGGGAAGHTTTGGTTGTGGNGAAGAHAGAGTSMTAGGHGAGASGTPAGNDSGCGCRTSGRTNGASGWVVALLVTLARVRRRRSIAAPLRRTAPKRCDARTPDHSFQPPI